MANRSLESPRRHERAVKHNENKNPSISVRCMTDEQNRSSQMAHGWTGAYCRYFDYLVTVDITHVAPHHQRHRYESTITMKWSVSDLQLGPMKDRDDYQATTRLLVNIRKEQSRANTYILKMQRTRQRSTLHPKVQQRLDWLSEYYEEHFSKTELIFFFLVMYAKLVAIRSMARHSVGRSPMA